MKKVSKILYLSAIYCILSVLGISTVWASTEKPVTAYLLMAWDGSMETLSDYAEGEKPVHFDRLNISFLKPHLPITGWEPHEKAKGLVAAGIISAEQAAQNPHYDLQALISRLHERYPDMKVAISVGGWAFSKCQEATPSGCEPQGIDNFPLSPKVMDASITSKISYRADIQQVTSNFDAIMQAWVNFAVAYGFDIVDVDYEENWYATAYAIKSPTPAYHQRNWESPPLILPQTVAKFGFIMEALETKVYTHNQQVKQTQRPLLVTVAAPSVAAFNIHTIINTGNLYWKPTNYFTQAPDPNGGNLKGLYYDVLHMRSLTEENKYDFEHYSSALFDNFPYLLASPDDAQVKERKLSGLDSMGIMTYDLDDGYVAYDNKNPANGVSSFWCIGENTTRGDTPDQGWNSVDCSIRGQTIVLTGMFSKMYQKVGTNENIVQPPKLAFGLEVGFANYPINLDATLPGGGSGDAAIADVHYRWNDPWAIYGIPLKFTGTLLDVSSLDNLHNDYLSLTDKGKDGYTLFEAVDNAVKNKNPKIDGTSGVIVWSVNNKPYNDFLSHTGVDYHEFTNRNEKVFGHILDSYGWDNIEKIFNQAASPEDILQASCAYYDSCLRG